PQVLARVPDARLLLVGGGPYERRLRRLVAASPAAAPLALPGEVPWPDLPAHYAAGDVFAMPCRTRWLGLDLEALGVVFLEAAATGLPGGAGGSGGAPGGGAGPGGPRGGVPGGGRDGAAGGGRALGRRPRDGRRGGDWHGGRRAAARGGVGARGRERAG